MIDTIPVRGETLAVMGLARSGLVAARALMASGARVLAWDDSLERRAEGAAAGLQICDLGAVPLGGVRSLVLSPGIPHTHPRPHPIAARARWEGIEVIGDIELLGRADPEARYLGITGTNGKSTTTALTGHIMTGGSGGPVAVGGNLGPPVLGFPAVGPAGWYVLELSSYQLELTFSVRWAVTVLLNITPDHLDRHGGLEGYIHAKSLIFHRIPGLPQTAVIGVDDPHCRRLAEQAAATGFTVVPISVERTLDHGVFSVDGRLIDATGSAPVEVMDLRTVASLPGAHNWQNACAAYAACRAAGVSAERITAAVQSFPGLPHRQQLSTEVEGIRFVNDSKATNADAAAKALGCYDDIFWILGGRPKESGLDGLETYMPRVRHAFLIGEATERFALWLDAHRVPYTRCGELASAIRHAFAHAVAARRAGSVVLLSPACASFDQFPNFEARGNAFCQMAATLREERRS